MPILHLHQNNPSNQFAKHYFMHFPCKWQLPIPELLYARCNSNLVDHGVYSSQLSHEVTII